MTIIHPVYWQIYIRKPDGWCCKTGAVFYNPNNQAVDPDNFCSLYNLTHEDVIIELFRRYHGKLGYYLANLRDKQYHYCGLEFKDVRTKFLELGIGRVDPIK
ncbi:hypothetical protein G7B40_040260 [Aetokthonos hydrillicola Thurmond2011]|jgi:hypothetical protein|uniref:Uncharacterized protein n=1 Tax=Aetokthonos hydrillicola Thurmond2011 TaxID=2712845 RepID=A0AAP5MEC3_9CYAN|nr:hypothetical protein [Aetokthonos hydrillicola]MBO3459963.1 hypothetical protein [Aetokthonos hydrillicola CCALA 1050]MBW4584082.1 hypothetical protein [Aetokthonos hydrillicola CCALA 1050]MDR9900724.1 hypothetical protein [Aetokthonos hydrillicola Thurmond2011]